MEGSKPKPAEGESNAERIANWVKFDKKAKADIILSLSASEICHVKTLDTSRDAWTALERVYASKGPAKRATLLKKLLFTRLTNNGSMADHLNKLFDIVDKLQEMDIPVADDLLTIVTLYSIPRSYEGFKCAIEARSRLAKEDTQDALYVKHGNPYKPKHVYSKTNAEELAFKHRSNDSTSGANKPYKCTYCKKLGHKAGDCWKKKSNRQHQARYCDKNYKAFMTHGNCQNALALSALGSITKRKDVWCLDSGATSHMCNDGSLFSKLQTVTGKDVGLAVDKTVEIKGIGTVCLTLATGRDVKNVKCEDTLYVPDLKTNLLSVASLTKNGKKVTFVMDK